MVEPNPIYQKNGNTNQ